VVATTAGCGASATAPPAAALPEFGPIVDLSAPVSTPGWEDSGYITPDGLTLYFSYLRVDPFALLEHDSVVVTGPIRPGWPGMDTATAQIYVAQFADGLWQVPQNIGPPINLPDDFQSGEWVSEDGNRILFVGGNGPPPERPRTGIYYAERVGGVWTRPVYAADLGFPFVEGDGNPQLTRDEQTLFFESSRPGGYGLQDLYISRRVNGVWTPAQNLGPPVNTAGVEGSPFTFDGTVLYYDDKGAGVGIRRSVRQPDGSWSTPEVVLHGILGDPSMTLTNDLYVTHATVQGTRLDANIAVAHPLPAATP
jgi:hypothetical protein